MTIKECLREDGIIISCNVTLHRCGEVEVFFRDENDEPDSTCFDVMDPLGKRGENELDELYKEFCKENNFPRNTVDEIQLNCVAESMERLAEIC